MSGFTRNCGGGSTTADIVGGGGEGKERGDDEVVDDDGDDEVEEDGRSVRSGGKGSGTTFLVWASSMRNSRGGGCVKE